MNNSNGSNNDEINELELYLSRKYTKQQKDEYDDNPLLYWNNNARKLEMNKLSRLAIFIHSMQCSESPSENLFSLSNNLINEKRTQLDDTLISLMTFLMSRWKLNKKKNS